MALCWRAMLRTDLPAASGQREIVWLIAGLWLVGFLVMAVPALGSREPGIDLLHAAVMAALGAALCLVLWRWMVANPRITSLRAPLLVGGLLAAIAVHTALDIGLSAALNNVLGLQPAAATIVASNPFRALFMRLAAASNGLLFAGLYALFGITAVALRSATEARERERLLAEARATAAQAQLGMLRLQISPHFVFNTLNAIGSLVETGRPREAGEVIDRLSAFLRSSLGAEQEPFVTLDQELATLQDYLEIEAVRFGERLRVVYEIHADLGQAMVPSFILQPLVENAIKHAVAPAVRGVTVTLSARRESDRLLLTISDDGADKVTQPATKPRGAGVGLANVRERLAILYGSKGVLDAGPAGEGFSALVRLPFRPADSRAAA